MKTREREMARKLRAAGWSVKQIARHLAVSQSSVSGWVHDVALSPGQRTALAKRVTEGRLASNARIRARARSMVNVYSKYSLKKRANQLPYGTCRVAVHSTRIVQTIYGSIQEYGGFERPEWLD